MNIRTSLDRYPFTMSEQHHLMTQPDDVSWVRKKYGERLFIALQQESAQSITTPDAQTEIILSSDLPEEVSHNRITGLRRGIGKEVNKLIFKRSGITAHGKRLRELPMSKYLDKDTVYSRYMTSVPSVADSIIDNDLEAEEKLRLGRQTAFALYSEIMQSRNVESVGKECAMSMLETCFRICSDNKHIFIVTNGLGGSEDNANVRLPSYVVASLELLAIFKKYYDQGAINFMPTLRILFAPKTSLINDMDEECVQRTTCGKKQVINQFIENYTPDLSSYIVFDTDTNIHVPSEVESENYYANTQLTDGDQKLISEATVRTLDKGRTIDPERAKRQSRRYIASHPFLFMDVIGERWQPDLHSKNIDISWSLGGGGETLFNSFRSRFATLLTSLHSDAYAPLTARIIQSAGRNPPYYSVIGVDQDIASVNGRMLQPDWDKNPHIESSKRKQLQTDWQVLYDFVRESLAKRHEIDPTEISDETVEASLKECYSSMVFTSSSV